MTHDALHGTSPPQISMPFDFVRNVLSGAWEGLPASATRHLPVRTLDSVLTGGPIPFFQVVQVLPARL